MDLEKQSKKDLILNEIQVMKQYSHKNIVNFIDGYFYHDKLWVNIYIYIFLFYYYPNNKMKGMMIYKYLL